MAVWNTTQDTLFNNTTTTDYLLDTGQRKTDNFSEVVTNVVAVLFTLTAVSGLFGNMLVILVILFNKTMRNSTNFLVLNLAFTDMLFLLICVPFTAVKYATPVWVFGDLWCRIMNYMGYVCAWVSAYTLVLMSLDRFCAIVFAIRARNLRTKRNAIIAIIVVWITVSLANIPAWLFHGVVEYEYGNMAHRKTCYFLTEKVDETSTLVFHFCYFVFGFMLPVIAITILYSILVAFLMRRTIRGNVVSKNEAKTRKKVTMMVILVIVVFIVCWLPIHIILVLTHMRKYPQSKDFIALQIAANCLAYMNSCMNPFLYTISSSTFRQAFKDFLCRRGCYNVTPTISATTVTTEVVANSTQDISPERQAFLGLKKLDEQ